MGIMLIQYNSKLLDDERRKDVGTLKIRGASGWQALRWVLGSAALTAAIGSIGAIGLGIVAGILSGNVQSFLQFIPASLSEFSLIISLNAIVLVFFFSFSLGILVALPSAIMAFSMTPDEAHSKIDRIILAGKEKLGNPFAEILAFLLSIYILVPVLQVFSSFALLGLSMLSYIATVTPLLLIVVLSLSRLLSRPTNIIKSAVLSIFNTHSIGVGTRILSRNVRMFKKSEAMSVMFIAMVFCSGIFASAAAATGDMQMRNLIHFEVGADIVVGVKSNLQNITIDMAEYIQSVEGVANVSAMYQTVAYVGYWTTSYWNDRLYSNRSYTVFAIQSQEWLETAFLFEYFTAKSSPSYSIGQLHNSSDVITTFEPIDHYSSSSEGEISPVYGDQLVIELMGPTWKNSTDSTVLDVMAEREHDAYGQGYFPGSPTATRFVVMDIGYVHACQNHSRVSKFFVKLEDGANYTQVMQGIQSIAPSSWSKIESAQARIDEAFNTRAGQAIFGVYTLNAIFSLFYLSAGMIVVSIMKINSLRKQMAILRALGTSKRTISTPLLIDTSLGILIALIIGGIMGLVLTNFVIQFPLVYYGSSTAISWTRLPIQIQLPFMLLTGIVGISLLFSLGATRYVTTKAIQRNIAEEIKDTE
jgi:predicted lysophospholipase L1 biosynthesis ABC-type transport system permease subunit